MRQLSWYANCVSIGVVVRHYRQLRAWQLADRLLGLVLHFTDTQPACRDRGFCDQIRSSCRSIRSNPSEGFARYAHRDFARFVVIARGSLTETQNHLEEARARKFVSEEEFRKIWRVSQEAMATTTSLLTYLQTHPNVPTDRKRR